VPFPLLPSPPDALFDGGGCGQFWRTGVGHMAQSRHIYLLYFSPNGWDAAQERHVGWEKYKGVAHSALNRRTRPAFAEVGGGPLCEEDLSDRLHQADCRRGRNPGRPERSVDAVL
jgi:hypothetical protein